MSGSCSHNTQSADPAALLAQLHAREQECEELRRAIDESASRHTGAVMSLRATHARTVAELQQSEASSVALAKLEVQQEADAAKAKVQARLTEAEGHCAELTADMERKDTLLAMHQRREKPKETFASCVDELKSTQARMAAAREASGLKSELAESTLALAECKSALMASEAREAELRARCDELQLSLEAALRKSFQATTQCQARERELRRALSSSQAEQQPTKAAPASASTEVGPEARPAKRAASFARPKRRELGAADEGGYGAGDARKQLTRAASFMRGGGSSKRKRVV
tara:strand:+ start:1441 stop:2310 length:870 start_codon:yes stop_codon:yes gene_type:complete